MITDDKLEEIIRDRFKVMGLRAACRNKGTFIFELTSMYGDSLDAQKAKDIYAKVKEELVPKEDT